MFIEMINKNGFYFVHEFIEMINKNGFLYKV